MSIKEVIGMSLFVVYTGFIYLFIFKTVWTSFGLNPEQEWTQTQKARTINL